jgi:hypothetical protein
MLTFSRLFCVVSFSALLGQAADFFPLAVGNQWIYRTDGGLVKETVITEIRGIERSANREYFLYAGLGGELTRLRYNEAGQLVALRGDGSEALWGDFQADQYAAQVDVCSGAAKVVDRNLTLELDTRQFSGALDVRYSPGPCADAGVTRDVFIPGVGLGQRETTSFTGLRRYRLTYARIGGVAVMATGEHSFRLSLDRVSYPPEFEFNARMTLDNSTGEPLLLRFNSGQSFDLVVRDTRGNRVYTWSATRLFPAVVREELVEGEKNWTASDRLRLEPGEYTMEAVLTTGERRAYWAMVPLTVVR